MRARINQNVFKLGVMYVSIVIFLTATNPNKLPSVILVVPFMFFFLAFYASVMVVLASVRDRRRQTIIGMQVLRPKIVACLVAGFPVLLMVLQSIGQLTVKDVIMTAIICMISYFYVAKFSTSFSGR
jgi:hypothetical protein